MTFKKIFAAMALGLITMSSNAALYDLSGTITDAGGAVQALLAGATDVGGVVDINDDAVGSGAAGTGAYDGIGVEVGGIFCFSSGTQSCGAPTQVPITNIAVSTVMFDGAGNITSGTLLIEAMGQVLTFLPVRFEFDAVGSGSFFVNDPADGGNAALGFANGTFAMTPQAVIPVPAAVWLLGSGLLGLVGLRRRK